MKEELERACDPSHEKPPSREACLNRPCYGKWRTGDWSKVSDLVSSFVLLVHTGSKKNNYETRAISQSGALLAACFVTSFQEPVQPI